MKTATIAAALAVATLAAAAHADVFATGPMADDRDGRVVLTCHASEAPRMRRYATIARRVESARHIR